MASINGRGDHASREGVRGEAPTQSTSRAGDRQMMDDMGSEVFNLKLAVQEYEDRLAKLYQTEDRSMWRGSASLLNDLEAADREVDQLEDTVADLQRKLIVARGGRVSGIEGGAGTGGSNTMSSLDSEEELDHHRAYVAELQEQITELEEDNRVLMEASGWQRCDLSEGEEEDDMLVPTGRSRRVRAVDVLSDKIKELHGLVALAEEREEAATSAAGEAFAERDDAATKIEELQAAAERYKQGKAIAEESVDALRSEMEQRLNVQRAEEDEASKAPTAAPAATRAAGVNTEPCTLAGEVELPAEVRDRLNRLEANVQLWREACSAANDELRQEKNLGGDTARRLAEKEASVRELTARLREKVATPAGRSMECGQRHGQLSCEVSLSKGGSKGKHGSREGSCCSHDSPSESTSTLADAAWKAVGASPGTHAGGGRRANGGSVHQASPSTAEEIILTETAAASTVETGDTWAAAEQGRGARQHGVAAAVRQAEEASDADNGGIHSGADTSEGSSMLASSGASEVGWAGGGGGDGRDEPSTAECSTETLGGGAGVSFSIASGGDMEEGEGGAAAVPVPEVRETGHGRQRQGQRRDRQYHRQRRISSVSESATRVRPPSPPAERGVKKAASSTMAAQPHNSGDYCAPAAANKRSMRSGLNQVPVCFPTAGVDDRVAVRRAEIAAHRAEVSAQRAECSAENARSDRLAAELAAADAGATAAAQRAACSAENSRADRLAAELAASKARSTTAAMTAGMAPSHGSFVGVDQQASNRLRRKPSALQSRIPVAADSKAVAAATAPAHFSVETAVPLAVAPAQNSTDDQFFSTTTSESTSELRDGEDDGDRRARRAARLAERASVAARLELLSAAAARERSAGSFSSSTEGLIRRAAHGGGHATSPGARWRGRQSFTESEADGSSLASEEGFRRLDGHRRGDSARQDASERDGENGELSRVAAAVAAAAAAAAKNGFISVAGGNNGGQVASGQASAARDYWQQPVLAAAEAASATGDNESQLSSSMVISKSPSLTGSEKYSPRRAVVASGRAVAVGRTHAHRGGSGAQSGLRATEFSARPATTNTTRTGHGKQVDGAAVTASAKARRALEEVGAGRGGVIDRPRRDSLGYIRHNEHESGVYGRGFDYMDPFGQDLSGSGHGAACYDGNKAAGGATTGSRTGGRPQKKLRKKTPAPPAPDRRVFRHAHGGPCARSCACSSCPCADATPGISSSWHLRRRRPATAGMR